MTTMMMVFAAEGHLDFIEATWVEADLDPFIALPASMRDEPIYDPEPPSFEELIEGLEDEDESEWAEEGIPWPE